MVGGSLLIDVNADPLVQSALEQVAATQRIILAGEKRKKAAEIDPQVNVLLRESPAGRRRPAGSRTPFPG